MSFLQRLLGRPNIDKLMHKSDVKGLIKALRYVDSDIRQKAARALGQIGDAQVINSLIPLLRDKEPSVRLAATEALDKLGWQPGIDEIGVFYWIVKEQWQKCVAIGQPALHPLITTLQNSNEPLPVRLACYSALEQIPGSNISEDDTKKLVESTATEIRRLYSRTRTITETKKVWVATNWSMGGEALDGEWVDSNESDYYEESDPDFEGIKDLIALIPMTLHEKVRVLSGQAKFLF